MTELTDADRRQLGLIHKSLYDPWGLRMVKETPHALAAFELLANWIDKVSRLSTGRKKKGEPAWRHFARRYLARHVSEQEVHLLYDGLRCKLSHEAGTRGVMLTNNDPANHWTYPGGLLLLNLESLIEEYEAAFLSFYDALQHDAALRLGVLPHADALITPIRVGATSASIGGSETLLHPYASAIAASATAPPDVSIVRDEHGWHRMPDS